MTVDDVDGGAVVAGGEFVDVAVADGGGDGGAD